MALSNELLSQFVKATKDDKKVQNEATVYGTVKTVGGKTYVQLDGSDLLTPVATTADAKDDERVTVMIKNHTATISGNLSSPSASSKDLSDAVNQISEFEIIMSYKVSTEELEAANATIESLRANLAKITDLESVYADIENLQAKFAELKYVNADDITAINAVIEKLEATFGTFTDISTDDLEALNAHIAVLKGYTADFTYVSAEVLEAVKASIKQLDVNKLSTEEAKIKYANIDFSNIGQAAIEYFYSKSGLIEDVVVGDGTITGTLIGVTIKGDTIQGGTIVADKLVIQGEDGLYYKLNFESGTFTDAEEVPVDGLHGSVIVANSITADKVHVTDLVAFGATIGGFNIGSNSLYSGVKESIDNSTRGIYMDTDGQIYLGDESNYIRYYRTTDEEGNEVYRLAISAESILFGADSKSSAADLKALTEHVKIGTIIDEDTGDEKPCVELSEGDSDFKQVITNVETRFVDGGVTKTKINSDGVHSDNIIVKDELRHEKWVTVNGKLKRGKWVWAMRSNGNYGMVWEE